MSRRQVLDDNEKRYQIKEKSWKEIVFARDVTALTLNIRQILTNTNSNLVRDPAQHTPVIK